MNLDFLSFKFETNDLIIITHEEYYSQFKKGKYDNRTIDILTFNKVDGIKKEILGIYQYKWDEINNFTLNKAIEVLKQFGEDFSFRESLLKFGVVFEGDITNAIYEGLFNKCKDNIEKYYKLPIHKRSQSKLNEIVVYDIDKFSNLSKKQLNLIINKEDKEIIDDLLIEETLKSSAYKWCLRGFKPFDAIKKVIVETKFLKLKSIENFININSKYYTEFSKNKEELLLDEIKELIKQDFTYEEISKKLKISDYKLNKLKEII